MTSIFDGVVWPPVLPEPPDPLAEFRAEFHDALLALVHALERPVIVQSNTPNVRVAAPEITLPDMDSLQSEIAGLRADVRALAALLSRPVTRTVERDDQGLIESVKETR